MRFAIQNGQIVPVELLPSTAESFPIFQLDPLPQPLNHSFPYNQNLQKMLAGKQLLLDDLPFPIQEIHSHYENGYLLYRKSIVIENHKPSCVRCGNKNKIEFAVFPCARCKERCTYCRKCIMMGRTSTCTPLVSWTSPINEMLPSSTEKNSEPVVYKGSKSTDKGENVSLSNVNNTSFLHWTGTLSPGQMNASNLVVEAIRKSDSLLVWAVCGAGKTEVLFKGIDSALQAGKRICIATPRTDVVLELAPRLKKVFPTTLIAALYGGSEDRHVFASLTIVTTHQLLRFYQAFDVIILDEVDAFPYSVDKSLQYAVEHARKDISSMIYLTATPNKSWQKECKKGIRKFVTIPARFHRHTLPVPQFVWCGDWRKKWKKGQLPVNVLYWLKQRIETETQALLFFPRIDLMEKMLPLLQKIDPRIEAVHSEDPNRKEKVQKMRQKEIPILLTTTILERGVTFPKLDVAVIGAEDNIFTESALVQIAGRVGRSPDYPQGNVTFFHYGKTNSMVHAHKQIVRMNKEAKEKGLVDYET